jgi:outer membrane protein OmpU
MRENEMKKILLATSILAGSAGVAMADVSFSGNAYMGVSNVFDGDADFEFISRVRIKATASGETDSGLTFGAEVESHNFGNAGQTGNSDSNEYSTVYLSGSFGKITFGDVGDASDNLIGNVDGVGLNLEGHKYNELGYIGNDKTAVKYEGTFGNLSVTVGLGQLDTDEGGDDQDMSIAVKYSFGDYAVYAGYANSMNWDGVTQTDIDEATIGADATFGNFTVKFRAQDNSAESDPTYALSGTGTFDAISVTAYYAAHDTFNAYGIGGSYDLGGGAKFKAGAATTDVSGDETWIDMGLSFDF